MKYHTRFRRVMGRILFCSVAASMLMTVILLSVYLPPAPDGMQDVIVPDLRGALYEKNDPKLPTALFRVTVEYRTDDTHSAGVILSQSPAPQAVRRVLAGKMPCALHLVISAGKSRITLPNLSGQSADTAERMLREMGLNVLRERRISNDFNTGQVIKTVPPGGAVLSRGETVVVIEGTTATRRTLTVPNVIGMNAAEAKKTLLHAGFIVDEILYRAAAQPADTVLAQLPAEETQVTSANTRVTLTLSDGSLPPLPAE